MAITELESDEDLEAVLAEPLSVIYKHSPICHRSVVSRVQMTEFSKTHPEIPVYLVDVIERRRASDEIAERFGIRHESPQVFVVRNGTPTWYGSQRNVTAQNLENNLNEQEELD